MKFWPVSVVPKYLNFATPSKDLFAIFMLCFCLAFLRDINISFVFSEFTSKPTFFFPPEDGVGLEPKRGCLLTLAYYSFPRWYEFGERWWNDILTGENRRTRRKTCPSVNLSTTNPTWIDQGVNPGLLDERQATNYRSHGKANQPSY
jgi:hypothetical protein